jgi:hypothetical protein
MHSIEQDLAIGPAARALYRDPEWFHAYRRGFIPFQG